MKNFVRTLTVWTLAILLLATFSLSALAAQPEETQSADTMIQEIWEQYQEAVQQQAQENEENYAQQQQSQMDLYQALVDAQNQAFEQKQQEAQQMIQQKSEENKKEVQQAYQEALERVNRHQQDAMENVFDTMSIFLLVISILLLIARIVLLFCILCAAANCGRTKAWAFVVLASVAAGVVVLVFMRTRWARK